MRIFDHLQRESILFMDGGSKAQVIEAAVSRAGELSYLNDIEAFREAVLSRELIVSTGLGLGVAVPHAKIAGVKEFFVVPVILRSGIDWDAIDHAPVRLVFLIDGPEDQQQQYLQILAKIVLVTKNPALRERLLSANSADEVLTIFEDL